jgi:hypothetical protein
MRYPWAVPGRKVVCVDTSVRLIKDTAGEYHPPSRWGIPTPVEGETYTIEGIYETTNGDGIGIRLVEINNAGKPSDEYNIGYAPWRFRPLHTIEDDVALFTELLTPAPNAPMLPEKEHVR